jgi:hypothetical protein
LYPAKRMISEIMHHFKDIDGNFVEQFQSTGFDARLWELYLYNFFVEEGFEFNREHYAPDFFLNKFEDNIFVEAVIVGRKADNPPRYFKALPDIKLSEDIIEANKDEMPLRFGSPLFSKLQKQYWDLPHVTGNPLILAIADFHDDQSMLWSSTALMRYLYGVDNNYYYVDNKLVIETVPIVSHVKPSGTSVPSGFFFQPETENISAVISSASGTISKFNRLGRQAGFKDEM